MPPKKSARPYVEHLTTNLKAQNGKPRALQLGPKTIIVGPNGSGKSAIQQALQLALIGSADDIVGRLNVKDSGMLMSMVSAERLSAHAKLNNGEDYVFIAKESGKPTHDISAPAVLPLQQVREVLEGSPATARKAFLGWAAGSVTSGDVEEMVPAIYQAKYKDISGAVGRSKPPVDALLATLEYVGKRQRDASKEANGAEALLTTLTDDLDPCPTEEDINAAKWHADLRANRAAGVREAQRGQEALLQKITGIREKLKSATAPVTNAFEQKFYSSMAYAASFAVERGVESCPLCSSAVGKAHIEMCGQFYQQQASAGAAPSAPPVDRAALQAQLDSLAEDLAQIEESASMNLADAEDEATQARDNYLALRGLADRWASLKKARDTAAEMSRESETYKGMKKELEGIVAALLRRVSEAFVARVQAYLPAGWLFGMQLVDGDKDVFRVGLLSGGKVRAALSGAEWATVTCALAMTIAAGTPAEQPVLVMPEDRGWDTQTLSKVLAAWSGFDGQVVIGTPTKPKKIPVGWTIIETGKSEEDEPEAVTPSIVDAVKPTMSVFVPSVSMSAMLKALGYTDAGISKMTRESAALIIANGVAAGKES